MKTTIQVMIKEEELKPTVTMTGMLIDELAYSIGQWTSTDVDDANIDFQPREPYMFDYEADLFGRTKTVTETQALMFELTGAYSVTLLQDDVKDLQAGAYLALNNHKEWSDLLKAYEQALKDQDIQSEKFETDLQKEIDAFNEQQYEEYLYGDRDSVGVVSLIRKHYGADLCDFDAKNSDIITFHFDRDEAAELVRDYFDCDLTEETLKKYLLTQIIDGKASNSRKIAESREKAKAESERLRAYRKGKEEKAEAARREKLLSMKLAK